jgi:hypothetical protein
MTYTREWDESKPLGSEAAKNIDDILRAFKVDIRERMNSFIDDWTADPVVLQSGLVTEVTTIPFPAFISSTPAIVAVHQNEHVVCPFDAVMNAAVPLPVGRTITKVDFLTDIDSCPGVTLSLVSYEPTPVVTPTVEFTVTDSTSGENTNSSGTLAVVGAPYRWVYIQVHATGGSGGDTFKIFGAQITTIPTP